MMHLYAETSRQLRPALYLCIMITFGMILSCNKANDVKVEPKKEYQWQFKEGSRTLKGIVDTAYIDPNNSSDKRLMILGTATDGTFFFLSVLGFDNKRINTYESPDVSFTYNHNADIIYMNNPSNAGDFTLTITQIDSLNFIGTFHGRVKDGLSLDKQIIEGRFHTNYFTP